MILMLPVRRIPTECVFLPCMPQQALHPSLVLPWARGRALGLLESKGRAPPWRKMISPIKNLLGGHVTRCSANQWGLFRGHIVTKSSFGAALSCTYATTATKWGWHHVRTLGPKLMLPTLCSCPSHVSSRQSHSDAWLGYDVSSNFFSSLAQRYRHGTWTLRPLLRQLLMVS